MQFGKSCLAFNCYRSSSKPLGSRLELGRRPSWRLSVPRRIFANFSLDSQQVSTALIHHSALFLFIPNRIAINVDENRIRMAGKDAWRPRWIGRCPNRTPVAACFHRPSTIAISNQRLATSAIEMSSVGDFAPVPVRYWGSAFGLLALS